MTATRDPDPFAGLSDALAERVAARVLDALIPLLGTQPPTAEAFSLEDAADYLGVSLSTLRRRYLNTGRLGVVRHGRRVVVPREQLDALLRVA